jgi:integrase/recombinase XerD
MGDPSRIRVTGPLEPYLSGFVAELVERGYTQVSVAHQLRLMAHLSRWLASEGFGPGDLSPARVEEFVVARRAAGYVNYLTPRALVALLEYLRGVGVVPPGGEPVLSRVDELLGCYRAWLCSERGLAAVTARNYADMARPFVASRLNTAGELDLRSLSAGDVLAFVLAQCPHRRPGSAKLSVTALRSLLGYLHVEGVIARPLAPVVPSVAGWRLAGLPRGLGAEQVTALLAGCDRDTAVGARDFAILKLLIRLGMRRGEVAALTLEDIDWRCGGIVVRGKGSRSERLPLPPTWRSKSARSSAQLHSTLVLGATSRRIRSSPFSKRSDYPDPATSDPPATQGFSSSSRDRPGVEIVPVTAMHERVLAEHVLDRAAQRPPAVDHEQDRLIGIEAAVDEVGQQHPDQRRVLRRAFPQPERDLHALRADPERDDVRPVGDLQPVEHHHRQAHVIQPPAHQLRQRGAGLLNEQLRRRTTSSTSRSISECTTPSPKLTLSASNPSLAAPTSSPSGSTISAGSGLSSASAAVTTCGPDTFFMAVPPVLADLVSAPNAPNRSGRGGRTATQSSTRSRTTSRWRRIVRASLTNAEPVNPVRRLALEFSERPPSCRAC